VNVRVIAATSRNLAELVSSGDFRQDLFYRVNVLTIQLPPLRERREDIPLLCEQFLAECCHRHERPRPELDPDLQRFFENYEWPGNVRQLRNTIENMIVMSRGPMLSPVDLPAYLSGNPAELTQENTTGALANLQDLERRAILSALDRWHGNRTRAAHALGISVRTLQRKLKAWGMSAMDELPAVSSN
jgi:DNA-binding NtrC family response regulator